MVINKEMALQMTLRDTLRFDLEKSSIYKRANVRPVFGAEDEDILREVPDDTPIDCYDISVMNACHLGVTALTAWLKPCPPDAT